MSTAEGPRRRLRLAAVLSAAAALVATVTVVGGAAFAATLFSDDGGQLITHYFSPNVFEGDTVRATWRDSRDTSTIWAQAKNSSSDPNFVAPGAIAWVLLQRVGSQDGPDGGDTLTETTFVQRLSTSGGVAPSTGCETSNDVGHQAFVPYTADYFFYTGAA